LYYSFNMKDTLWKLTIHETMTLHNETSFLLHIQATAIWNRPSSHVYLQFTTDFLKNMRHCFHTSTLLTSLFAMTPLCYAAVMQETFDVHKLRHISNVHSWILIRYMNDTIAILRKCGKQFSETVNIYLHGNLKFHTVI
jgi:hypothetical protein